MGSGAGAAVRLRIAARDAGQVGARVETPSRIPSRSLSGGTMGAPHSMAPSARSAAVPRPLEEARADGRGKTPAARRLVVNAEGDVGGGAARSQERVTEGCSGEELGADAESAAAHRDARVSCKLASER